jgi:hypothetical protein
MLMFFRADYFILFKVLVAYNGNSFLMSLLHILRQRYRNNEQKFSVIRLKIVFLLNSYSHGCQEAENLTRLNVPLLDDI